MEPGGIGLGLDLIACPCDNNTGSSLGIELGCDEGWLDGCPELLGLSLGCALCDGFPEGWLLGTADSLGDSLGCDDGSLDG